MPSTSFQFEGSCLARSIQDLKAGSTNELAQAVASNMVIFGPSDGAPDDGQTFDKLNAETTGQGFIVAQSSGTDGANKILGNLHVVRGSGLGEDYTIRVYNLDLSPIGTAHIVASGNWLPTKDHLKIAEEIDRGPGDLVVLSLQFVSEAAKAEYRERKGLRLAPVQNIGLLRFLPKTGSVGFVVGTSGTPFFDLNGEVSGIEQAGPSLIRFEPDKKRSVAGLVSFNLSDSLDPPQLPFTLVAPITGPPLKALGDAGKNIMLAHALSSSQVIAGAVLAGKCVATTGSLEPYAEWPAVALSSMTSAALTLH